MNPFVERHHDEIAGVISCFDRVVISGTLLDIGHAQAMSGYLTYRDIRLFDFPQWAQPLRDEIRDNAQRLACEANLDIEFIRSHKAFRKEQRIKDILKGRGEHPGLVHIFSAMETSGQPHIKSLSRQYVIAEAIIQCRPDTLLPDADLRWLALQKIKRHMSNHSHIMRRIASTNPALVFTERHI